MKYILGTLVRTVSEVLLFYSSLNAVESVHCLCVIPCVASLDEVSISWGLDRI